MSRQFDIPDIIIMFISYLSFIKRGVNNLDFRESYFIFAGVSLDLQTKKILYLAVTCIKLNICQKIELTKITNKMKRFYTTLLVLLTLPLIGFAASEEVPYSSDMTNWEIINGVGKTWEVNTYDFTGTGWSQGLKYTYDYSNDADDWAISPAIHLEGGKEYKVKFWFSTKSSNEDFTMYMGTSKDTESLKTGTVIYDLVNASQKEFVKIVKIITPAATGDYYFGAYLHSPKNRWNVLMTGFEVVENVFAPGTVTNLTVTEGENRALTASLSWTLPTVDNDGAPMPEDAVFNKVMIYRDSELVSTLDGPATSWEDNGEKGLTSGKHTYEVAVVVNNQTSAKASVISKYIGPVAPEELPWKFTTANMTEDDVNTYFAIKKGENSTSTGNWAKYGSTSSTCFRFTPGNNKQEDDWLFTPAVNILKPGIYRFGFEATYYDQGKTNFEVWMGNGNVPQSMTQKLTTLTSMPTTKTQYYVVFEVTEPGEYNFGLHANGLCNTYYSYSVFGFSAEEWVRCPEKASALKTAVEGNNVKLTWTNPEKDNLGNTITTLSKVEVYRDGELISTLTENILPGETSAYTDTPNTNGSFKYSVLPYIGEAASDQKADEVYSQWVGDKMQTLPYDVTFANVEVGGSMLYTAIDLDEDGFTWTLAPKTTPQLVFNKMGSDRVVNDRLVSPPMKFEKAGYYKMDIYTAGAANNNTLKIGLIDEENLRAELTDPQTVTYNGSMYGSTKTFYFYVSTPGTHCFAFDFNNSVKTTTYDCFITSLKVEYFPIVPGVAKELTVIPAENYVLSADVEWVNPTETNMAGVTPTLTKAVITRNGEEVATITENLVPGEKTTWTDENVPNNGVHEYAVAIHGPEGASQSIAKVTSPWIGGGLDLPYAQEDFSLWTCINVDNDKNAFGNPLSWTKKNNGLNMLCTSKPANDWAISPRMTFESGKAYDIEIESKLAVGSTVTDYSYELWLSEGTTVADMSQKLGVVEVPTTSKTSQTFTVLVVDPTEPATQADDADETDSFIRIPAGVHTIGFYANKAGEADVTNFAVNDHLLTGINTVGGEEAEIVVRGNEILFGMGASDIVVANLSGQILMRADKADSISMESFDKGIYILTAVVDGHRVSVKIVK